MPAMPTSPQLARDVRTDLIGEIIARPGDLARGTRGTYRLRQPDGGKVWDAPTDFVQLVYPEPTYWLRQRIGTPGTVRLSAAEVAMIAERPGTAGDHRAPSGLVWRERDPDALGGWTHYTITPVWECP